MKKMDESAWEKAYVEYWGRPDPVLVIAKSDDGSYKLGSISPLTAEKGTVAAAAGKDRDKLLDLAIAMAREFSWPHKSRNVYYLHGENDHTLLWGVVQGQLITNPFPTEE